MHWIAPSAKDTDDAALENRLWAAAEQPWPAPYTGLKSQGYSGGHPQGAVLGLSFLRFAEVRFADQRAQLESPSPLGRERVGVRGEVPTPRVSRRGSRMDDPLAKRNPAAELSIHGVEKTGETERLCRVNLAVHALDCDIRHGGNLNSYYDDPHDATGQSNLAFAA